LKCWRPTFLGWREILDGEDLIQKCQDRESRSRSRRDKSIPPGLVECVRDELTKREREIDLQNLNFCTIWWLLKATDQQWLLLFKAAAEKGSKECLKVLIENKADVNVWNIENGNSALHFACMSNLKEPADMLIGRKANVHSKNFEGKTALHLATQSRHIDCVQLLVENKADVAVTDRHGNTPLHYTCKSEENKPAVNINSLGCLNLLLEKYAEANADIGFYINARDKYNATPLFSACLSNEIECARKLIELKVTNGHSRGLASVLALAVREFGESAQNGLANVG
jgi:ankyrin repeat protein